MLGQINNSRKTRPRFSVRLMMGAVTALSLCVAVWVEQSERQRKAVSALRAIDYCEVHYDFDPPGPEPELVRVLDPAAVPPPPGWAAKFLGVDYFHGAVNVIVAADDIGTATPHLKRLPTLREVYVFYNGDDDETADARIEAAIGTLREELPGVAVKAHHGSVICFSTIPVVG